MDSFQSKLPARVESMALARWADDDEPGSRRLARFTKEIHWLIDDEGRVAVYINGVSTGYSNQKCYSGQTYGGGIQYHVADAVALAEKYQLVPGESIVEIAVLASRRERAMVQVPLGEWDRLERGPNYSWASSSWLSGDEETFRLIEGYDHKNPQYDFPTNVQLGEAGWFPPVKVWSSISPCSSEESLARFLSAYPLAESEKPGKVSE